MILGVIFISHNPLEFLCFVRFRELVSHKVEDMERTDVRLIAFFIKHFSHLMVFFIKHFSQCSLKSFTKSSKDLVIQLFALEQILIYIIKFWPQVVSRIIEENASFELAKKVFHLQFFDNLYNMINMFIQRKVGVPLAFHKYP